MTPDSAVTLLIVDDEPEIRSGLQSLLCWEEYSVLVIGTAASSVEALDKIRFYEPDIVITDIQMPGKNGLWLVQRAQEEQFDCSFIILTGYDEFQYAKTAIRYGVRDYLLKPVSISELKELILRLTEEILQRRAQSSDRISTLRKLRKAQVSLQQRDLLSQLLGNEISETQLNQVLASCALPIQNQPSCAVFIQAFSPLLEETDSAALDQSLSPLKQALTNELSGLPVLMADLPPSGLLLAMNCPFADARGLSLHDLLKQLLEQYAPSCSFHVFAAIGKEVSSLLEISSSSQTARQVMSWHIYPEAGRILDTSLLSIPQPDILMPDEGIWDAVLKNNAQEIRQCFTSWLSQLLASPMPPPSYLYSMCNYLIITIQNQMTRYLGRSSQCFTGNTYAALQNLASLEDISSWMCSLLFEFATELQVKRAAQTDPLMDKAISYIQENLLHNPRTEDLCSYLGLGKSYFSTYFKQKAGITFREYMLNLKITYAQEQLKLSCHSPGEIALSLGYEDYRSFSRAFKSRTGFSPSDYQKQYSPKTPENAVDE